MSLPEKVTPRPARTSRGDHQTRREVTPLVLSIAGAVCFLLAAHLTGVDQLIAISLGGLLAAGGSR